MRCTANRSRLNRRYASKTEIMQLEINERSIPGLFEVFKKHLFYFSRLCGHRARIPNLHEQRLEEIGEPETLRVGILNRHHHIGNGNGCSFGNRFNADRQFSAMLFQNVFPSFFIEQGGTSKMLRIQGFGLFDLFRSNDSALQITFEQVLQAEKYHLVEFTSPGFKIRIDL